MLKTRKRSGLVTYSYFEDSACIYMQRSKLGAVKRITIK